jgi:hypothetical protein
MAQSRHKCFAVLGIGLGLFSGVVGCVGRVGVIQDGPAAGSGRQPGSSPGAGGSPIPGSTGGGAAGGTTASQPPDLSHPSLGEAVLHRLTQQQYRNSLQDLLGMSAADLSQVKLEDDLRLSGLQSIGATATALSPRGTELLEAAADQIVARAFTDPARRVALTGCDPAQAACLQGFIAQFGRRAWRRPLGSEESARYVALAQLGATRTGDAWAGLRFAVMGLLQSPHFLYRVELGQPVAGDPTRRELTPFELASRLSFFLTDRGPDDALLDAAGQNKLSRAEDLAAQAQRLLGSPRATAALEHFYADYLDLDSLDGLSKDPTAFPDFTDALKAAMRSETVQTLRTLTFDEQADFRTLFTTRTTFVSAELARLYGLPAPSGAGSVRTQNAPGTRAGLLMHASLLSLNAHQGSTSPTRRGKFLRETILCQSIPDPPPNVMATLPATTSGTMRQRLAGHAKDPACATCHTLMDPVGLGLENFDAIGRLRGTDHGAAIDASGTLDDATFGGPLELAQAVAGHPRVPGCFTTTLLRQAAGDLLKTATEEAVAGVLGGQFKDAGFNVRALLIALVSQPAFRYVRPSEGG